MDASYIAYSMVIWRGFCSLIIVILIKPIISTIASYIKDKKKF